MGSTEDILVDLNFSRTIVIIYIILAHKSPDQLKRLIGRLNALNTYFYIHIDKKEDIGMYTYVIDNPHVYFIENRINCIWGDFSIVQATLNLIKQVLLDKRIGMAILLSGQDYPIKNKTFIENFILENNNKNFIDLRPIGMIWSEEECKKRTKQYRINLSSNKYHYFFCDIIDISAWLELKKYNYSLLDTISLLKSRKFVKHIELYGGSQWWAFNTYTLKHVYDFIISNKKLIKYFKYSHCADEIFFHSIIKHLSKTDTNIKIVESITYVNWSRPGCELPVVFKTSDFDELIKQPDSKLFAKKFDLIVDNEIFNELDKF